MTLAVSLFEQASNLLDIAQDLEKQGNYSEALLILKEGEHLLHHAWLECTEHDKVLEACVKSQLKVILINKERMNCQDPYPARSNLKDKNNLHHGEKDQGKDTGLEGRFEISTGGKGFDAIIGLENLKKIMEMTKFFLQHQDAEVSLSQRGLNINKNILLVGPPGTGKTRIVRAYFEEVHGSHLLELTPSELLSPMFGEGEAVLQEAIDQCKKRTPAIIVIDEIDGIFRSRDLNPTSGSASLLTQLLLLTNNTSGVQFIACTNVPWDIDPALLRRFGHVVYVPPPNKQERIDLLTYYSRKVSHGIAEEAKAEIGEKSDGYSASDIEIAVKKAASTYLLKAMEAKYFTKTTTKTGDEKWAPCEKEDPSGEPMSFDDNPLHQLEKSDLTASSIMEALQSIPKFKIGASQESTSQQPVHRSEGGKDVHNSMDKRMQEFVAKHAVDGRSEDFMEQLQYRNANVVIMRTPKRTAVTKHVKTQTKKKSLKKCMFVGCFALISFCVAGTLLAFLT